MNPLFPDISISTERLVLRAFDEGDVEACTEMMNDEAVVAWTSAPQPFTEAAALEWITRRATAQRLEGRGIVLAVTEFLTQRIVGVVELTATDWRVRSAELSYVIAPWARGEGYASEAALAISHWLFNDQRFARIELRTAADNTAAQQVALQIGCLSEGVLRGAWIARVRGETGEWTESRTDLIVWSLLPEDLDGVFDMLAEAGGAHTLSDWG
ncbi:GNAT family N-acetyltransferase [Streptomyces tsukubensis]|uniref:GNAT family N-acetyltransferase n=1 Tax=Streptomyces tsukubensis TaxID=83656 RepID=A0A1V4AF33_9ACTN|nr:GNAT family N-acetyltransferase [Streptomyces tsukubensis]OON82164.1 GNAT family N-acetyltransferase [Streptomyces tsukubensis]QFR92650.1 GNAT family N-acetyltransferase [Streptomyces tsukubensis]